MPASAKLLKATSPATDSRDKVPWQIWVVVVLLGLEGVGNLLEIPGNLEAVQWFAAKCLFILGLICSWRPVFVLFLVSALIHVEYFARSNYGGTALLNAAAVLLLASTFRRFFARRVGKISPGRAFDREFDG